MRSWATFGKFLISFALGGYIFAYHIDFSSFMSVVRKVAPVDFMLVLLFHLLQRFLTAFQMREYFSQLHIPLRTLAIFKIQLISSFYALFMPGDMVAGAVSWGYLVQEDGTKKAQFAAGLIYLRLVNLLTLIPFAALGVILEPRLRNQTIFPYFLLSILVLLAIASPLCIRKVSLIWEHALHTLFSFVPRSKTASRLTQINATLWDAVRVNYQMTLRQKLYLWTLSFAINGIGIIFVYLSAKTAFVQMPWTVNLWLTPLMTVIHSLPLTINGTGLREISLIYLLNTLYGIPNEAAMLLSAIVLVISILVGLWGGFYSLTFRTGKR